MIHIPPSTIANAFKDDDAVRAEISLCEREIAKLAPGPRRNGLKNWVYILQGYFEKDSGKVDHYYGA